jgi:hypothetical protein
MRSARRPEISGNESGQTIVEFVLLMIIVVLGFIFVSKGLTVVGFKKGLEKTVMSPITTDFAMAYKYGHPKAKGPDEGSLDHHPMNESEFKLFLNPVAQ